MKSSAIVSFVSAVVGALTFCAPRAALAAVYRPGDVVENVTLTDRTTRMPVRLSDLEGKIVFLEWFAWWCPFCQASAPQVEAGIVEWYASRAGNPSGIPVVHVAINLQPGQETQTQNFVTRAGFEFVLEDFNRGLANRFQSGGQPIFAIINGVTNSTSHKAWELLLHQDGYGQRDFTESLVRFREVIDRVKPAASIEAPSLVEGPKGAEIMEGDSWTLSVTATGGAPLSWQWFRDGQAIPGATDSQWTISPATAADSGSYTVQVSNAGGVAVGGPVTVAVRARPIPVPRLSHVGRMMDGMVTVEVADAAGKAPKLEFSSDLLQWRVVRDLTPNLPYQQVLLPVDGVGRGFFRVRNE